jgi:hypothetical protein
MVLFASSARGQETDYAIALDSGTRQQNVWVPTGLRLGADLLGPTIGLFDDSRSSYEFTADLDLRNFFFVAEAGFATATEAGTTAQYNSQGTFFRVGPDVNFLGREDELTVFFFGLRFAHAIYNETLTGIIEDQTWGTIEIDQEQANGKSNWVEMNTGLKVRLWQGIFAGYTLRFKFSRFSNTGDQQFETYYVPGYGLAGHVNNWSFNYYIFYRFQWKKKAIKWKEQ